MNVSLAASEIVEEDDMIIIKTCPSFFDLSGSGSGKGSVAKIKMIIDQMSDRDA